jgi:multiple sugar transport system substrate-binding protein
MNKIGKVRRITMNKKRMRALLSMLLIVVMVIGCTGCGASASGKGKGDKDGKITLTVTVASAELGNTKLFEQYMEEHPNIIIEEVPTSSTDTKLMSMIASGNPPDIIRFTGYDELPVFVQRGILMPLDEMLENSENYNRDDMHDIMSVCQFDGKERGKGSVYGIPKDWSPTGIWINKDVFAEEGIPLPSDTVPMTWDEYAALAQKLVKRNGEAIDRHGSITALPLPTLLEMYLSSYGNSMWNDDYSSTTLETAETKKAVKYFQKLHETGALASNLYPASDYIGISALLEDKVAMVLAGYWFRGGYGSAGRVDAAAEKLMFVPGPVGTAGSCYVLDQICAGIFSETDHPEEAYDLLEYLMLAEQGVTARTKVGLGLPVNKIYENTLPYETAFDKQTLDVVKNVQIDTLDLSPRICPYITYRSLTTLFDKYYLPVLYGRSTFDEAMESINREAEILIKEAKEVAGVK